MGADPSLPTSLSVVPDWDVGLVLGVPIFEGFLTTHHVREADAKVTVQREQEEDLRLTIVEQVREAFVDFKSSLEAVIAADANQVAAEEELKVISGRYNNGLGSILDLIIAQATTVTAEDEAVRARYQSGVARSVLELAIGAPPPSLPAPNQP
jgi:outer membrane protein